MIMYFISRASFLVVDNDPKVFQKFSFRCRRLGYLEIGGTKRHSKCITHFNRLWGSRFLSAVMVQTINGKEGSTRLNHCVLAESVSRIGVQTWRTSVTPPSHAAPDTSKKRAITKTTYWIHRRRAIECSDCIAVGNLIPSVVQILDTICGIECLCERSGGPNRKPNRV